MDIFVARQPIFNAKQKVYGYELLYRSARQDSYQESDGDKASLAVIRNSLLIIGPERITGGKKAFVNFTRNLLLNQAAFYLPKEIAVIEILEDVEMDEQLVTECKKIKSNGYLLALDDFDLAGNENNPLVPLADIIKVDFRATTRDQRRAIADYTNRFGHLKFLAEKTESREEFQEGVEDGYAYFQGYFFSKPVIISRKDIPGYKINYLRILDELNRVNTDFETIRNVIERDPSLTYKLLQYINCAFFGFRHEITSIRQALVLLGEKEVRKWASLAVLISLGKDQPGELIRVALLRAKFCEELASRAGMESQKTELFLMGMFSFMDVFFGRPLDEILQDIPLSANVKDALLGKTNPHKIVYDAVLSYERGNWEDASQLAMQLAVDEEQMIAIYSECIEWVEKTSRL